ncbi:MAG TPA: hypothetical protein PKB10_13815, partial [Tepidisphaeraceae bacterium]|nr:hypothetical protein [Tepidisphaeraceae bacterium]
VRQAVQKGLIGQVNSVHLECVWNHEWIADTHFNNVHQIILYDYGIHWFDAVSTFMPHATPTRVHATYGPAIKQRAKPPLIGQVLIEFDHGLASLVFNGAVSVGSHDAGVICGTKGAIRYDGPELGKHDVTLYTAKGVATPKLSGTWFKQGFMGTMG